MAKKKLTPEDCIVPLNISGLQGRMLHMPAPAGKDRDMVFVYGHHSILERWWGLMEVLNRYGAVTMPDLPGFGGMDSFYKVGRKPSIDNMADYLAAFIKWRYKRKKKITLVGMSFGFVVVTRMLQRYPELTKKVDLLVSLVGFVHKDDFSLSKPRILAYKLGTRFFSMTGPAFFFRYAVLNEPILRTFYARTHNAKNKFAAAVSKEDFNRLMDMEVKLWQWNDVRTYMYTTVEFLDVDNTKVPIDLPVWHVTTTNDHFFDHTVVEQHMRIIFSEFHEAETKLMSHAPSVIADAKMAEPLIPKVLRDALKAD